MKRAALSSNTGVAPIESIAEQTIGSTQSSRSRPLFDQLIEAARRDDRAEFDRVFDRCFAWVYAMAWCVTGDRKRSEAITAHILCEVMIETS